MSSSSDSEVKKEIFWLGHVKTDEHDEACGNCVEQQSWLGEVKQKRPDRIIETHGDIYAPEFQQIVEENKIKHMPWTRVCDIKPDTGEKTNCKTVSGFNKKKLEKLIG